MSLDAQRPKPPHRRSRSLKHLLQLPLLSRIGDSSTNLLVTIPLPGVLPSDVFLEIAEWLWRDDILNLSLASKAMRALLMPSLYETIIFGSSKSCDSGLSMLAKRPEVCRWVRKLAVRPNYYLAWPKNDKRIDESRVTQQLQQVLQRGSLHSLHTFDWDGRELAPDSLWNALRDCCPSLHTVYANVGYSAIDPTSSLFAFRNLKAFSLTVRHGLEAGVPDAMPDTEELPQALWDMLILHCPNIEELNICSFSPSIRLFDVSPITSGAWPELKCLVLGCFGYDNNLVFQLNSDMDAVSDWVGRHHKLEMLRFVWSFRRWSSPNDLPILPASQLSVYAGIYQQIPLSSSSLTTLDLTMEPIADDRVPILCPVLRSLDKLESLDIWMQVSSSEFVEPILASCTKLKEFHFMSTAKGDWVKGMQGLLVLHVPLLRIFSVTQGYDVKWRRGRMVKSAAKVAKMNERLEQINLRWVREKCRGYLKHDGRYEVVKVEGKSLTLVSWERGFSLLGPTFARQFKYTIQ